MASIFNREILLKDNKINEEKFDAFHKEFFNGILDQSLFLLKYDSFNSVIHNLFSVCVGPIIFKISYPSNFVAKNAVEFSGSLLEISVSIKSVSASSIIAFFGEHIVKMFFLFFFGFFKLCFSDMILAKDTIFFNLSL